MGNTPAHQFRRSICRRLPRVGSGRRHTNRIRKRQIIYIELNDKKPDFLKVSKSPRTFRNHPIPVNQLGPLTKSAQRGSKLPETLRKKSLNRKSKGKKKKNAVGIVRSIISNIRTGKELRPRSRYRVIHLKMEKSNKTETFGKRTSLPIQEQRRMLPVYAMRSQLLEAIRDNQFVVIVGETGSGKTPKLFNTSKRE